MSNEHVFALSRHPWTPADAVRGVEARVRRAGGGRLVVTFRVEGDLARLRIPPPAPPRFVMQLWEHTCCEAFLRVEGAPGYHEFNLAPSGAWAVFAFNGYREVSGLGDASLAPSITVRSAGGQLELAAILPLDRLSAAHGEAVLRLALAAVVEQTDGTLSYWALRHAAGKPDFHHADAFALRLEPPGAE